MIEQYEDGEEYGERHWINVVEQLKWEKTSEGIFLSLLLILQCEIEVEVKIPTRNATEKDIQDNLRVPARYLPYMPGQLVGLVMGEGGWQVRVVPKKKK